MAEELNDIEKAKIKRDNLRRKRLQRANEKHLMIQEKNEKIVNKLQDLRKKARNTKNKIAHCELKPRPRQEKQFKFLYDQMLSRIITETEIFLTSDPLSEDKTDIEFQKRRLNNMKETMNAARSLKSFVEDSVVKNNDIIEIQDARDEQEDLLINARKALEKAKKGFK